MSQAEPPLPNGNEPAFEESLSELEAVVRALEAGTLGLDDSIARFERGIALLRRCYRALERAEQKIELLTGFDAAGNPLTEPFDASATLGASPQAAPGRRSRKSVPRKAEPAEDAGASKPEESDPGGALF